MLLLVFLFALYVKAKRDNSSSIPQTLGDTKFQIAEGGLQA